MHISREAKLGLTAIIALVIFVWGLNFLKARSIFGDNNIYYGVYEQVDGLKVSSSVVYRGYAVGQVRDITFIGERFDHVLVEFSVNKDLRIPSNSIASIQNQDLMGTKNVSIIPGDAVDFAVTQDTLHTQVQLGIFEQVNQQMEPLKAKAENILTSLDLILSSLQGVLDGSGDQNNVGGIGSINRTLHNIEGVSESLNKMITSESQKIAKIIDNVESISGNLENNNEHIETTLRNVAALSDTIKEIQIQATMAKINSILTTVDSLAVALEQGRGTVGKLLTKDDIYYDLQALSNNLNTILVDLEKNPKKYINFSVFSSTPKDIDTYNVVIKRTEQPIDLGSELYRTYPNMRVVRQDGQYMYIVTSHKRLKSAEKDLETYQQKYPTAFILKLHETIN